MFKSPIVQKLLDERENPGVIHYKTLRKTIGILGMALPFVVWFGSLLTDHCQQLQPSISHYYYTNMREIFVGIICSYSFFLFTYNGHSRLDGIVSNAAAICALLVAIFPTDVLKFDCQKDVTPFIDVPFHRTIHLTSAATFFVLLAFMSLFLFTRSKHDDPSKRTLQKRRRNRVYRTCGVVMLASMAAIVIYFFADGDPLSPLVFGMEVVALLAFGFSWLTKGEAILEDK